ncbi:hypothetical protein [Schinkia azotoformans]|uniref:hypothetical protein n=1 Tax=Schinkia azotoformans TaxID=1454 RepID=UPI002DB5B47B|nr:hypothetical protein [Schinkia azotoformans]MEC1720608.1 hypothetical protein [Schinkia azotoformans]MED4411747.1 hypothetical protein [Schinkia azotoformans]
MLQGDTVRLKVNFKDFNGQSVNPTNVKLTIYDTNKTQIEQFILDDTYKLDVGVFFYDYVPANELNEFIFEFVGMVNNKPILSRDSVTIHFN